MSDLVGNGGSVRVPLTDEELKIISDAVDTLTMWSRKQFCDAEGFQPMWNPTLRRLRNLLASRSKEPKGKTE